MHRMVENGITPGSIDALFFTHHHIDHNADFYYFVITNWTRGEDELSIFGPQPTTDTLLSSMYEIYEEDIEYRTSARSDPEMIENIPTHEVKDEATFSATEWTVEAFAVEHSIETYGFMITEESTGSTTVISGDTKKTDSVIQAANNADLLIQDCSIAPPSGDPQRPEDEFVWDNYITGISTNKKDRIAEVHCTAEQCGEIATQSDVDTLVLTHLLPYRDKNSTKEIIQTAYDGNIIIGEDGMVFSV